MSRGEGPGGLSEVLTYLPGVALLPGAVLGAAALAGRGPRLLRARPRLGGVLLAGSVLGLVRWQFSRYFNEQPRYAREGRVAGLELRRYEPRVIAETTVRAEDWDEARNQGFRRLAAYIFGANDGDQKLAMTAPVEVSRAPERIAMTAPVTAQADHQGGVTVAFVMPRKHPLASLPQPFDPRVRLREQPGERVAVLSYRGTYGGERTAAAHAELLRRVHQAGLTPAGPVAFAGYDPPSTLPLFRRVEAWVSIA